MKNNKLKAYILYAEFSRDFSNQYFQSSEGWIDPHNYSFCKGLTITAKGLGLHKVHRTDTLKTKDSTKVYPLVVQLFSISSGCINRTG